MVNAAEPQRRLSAEERAAILREDQAFVGRPFDVKANPRAIQANTRHLALLLADKRRENRAAEAAMFYVNLVDVIMKAFAGGPVACAKGCSLCCNTFVSATIPEIFNLARAVQATASRKERVLIAARRSARIPQMQRELARLACPMLEDHACSEYPYRPLSCRYLLSKSLDACIKMFGPDSGGVEFQFGDNVVAIRSCAVVMMKTALKLNGLPSQYFELNQGLAVALSLPYAEERWLAGEALFSEVPVDRVDHSASPYSVMVDHLAGLLRPTL